MTQMGRELRELRIERDLTLDVAAKIIGISIQSLKIAENGEKKSKEVLSRIAMAYEVPIDYFIKYAHQGEVVTA